MAPTTGSSTRLPVFFGLRALNRAAFALVQIGQTQLAGHLVDQNRKDTVGKLV